MQRILLVKTSSLGDVIHNLPVVDDILAQFPEAQIDWVVEESFADIPRLHPKIHKVFVVAFRRWRKQLFSKSTWVEIAKFRVNIKQNKYDAIIDTQGLLKSGLLTTWAHGTKHGYDIRSAREPLASLFYDKKYTISYQQHAVIRNRTLAATSLGYAPPANVPNYGISQHDASDKASENLIDIDSLGNYIIALHGTSRDSKLWPIANWVTLGKALSNKNLNLVLPWASVAEELRAKEIANQLSNATVLPKLSIGQLASVMGSAQAAVGVDTGLSHLATALNIPTIAIYTDTNPALTGVMAGKQARAINLGGIGKIPSVDEVTSALTHLCLHS
jgi:heptosyltransferase I